MLTGMNNEPTLNILIQCPFLSLTEASVSGTPHLDTTSTMRCSYYTVSWPLTWANPRGGQNWSGWHWVGRPGGVTNHWWSGDSCSGDRSH